MPITYRNHLGRNHVTFQIPRAIRVRWWNRLRWWLWLKGQIAWFELNRERKWPWQS